MNPNGEGFEPPCDVISGEFDATPIICFNNLVRLQCPTTGLLSPMMAVRRVETGVTVSNGDTKPRKGDPSRTPAGENPAEPVCQLHKIAFELYAPVNGPCGPIWGQDKMNPGIWLNSEREKVDFRQPRTQRTWVPSPPKAGSRPNSVPPSPVGNYPALIHPITPQSAAAFGASGHPSTPTTPFQAGSYGMHPSGSGNDYFEPRKQSSSSSLHSQASHSGPLSPWDQASTEAAPMPGPTRRRRTSSGASSAASRYGNTPPSGAAHQARRRTSTEKAFSAALSLVANENGFYMPGPPSGRAVETECKRWQVDLLDTQTW